MHLPHTNSDHCPILLHLDKGEKDHLVRQPFRFQATCFFHSTFMEFLQSYWQEESSLHMSMVGFVAKVGVWNKEVFGDIIHRKNRIRS